MTTVMQKLYSLATRASSWLLDGGGGGGGSSGARLGGHQNNKTAD